MGCSKTKPVAMDKQMIDGPITEDLLASLNRPERFEIMRPL
jgi:hypothetical protein